jgi:L-threonylcarbamoyladenylate synthase
MSEPLLVVRRNERDAEGRLLPEHVEVVQRVLEEGGFVMLPSDTAYSVATWLLSERVRLQLNELLKREDAPLSLAFPSPEAVQRWTVRNDTAQRLLRRFTPGPITVVCTASPAIPFTVTHQLFGALNHTIGVRIPDSTVERQVAGVGESPISTVPVKDVNAEKTPPITDFAKALDAIRDRIAAFGGAPWAAIEGEWLDQGTSTVVEVLGDDGSYAILRTGPISEAQIVTCLGGRRPQVGG